LLGLAGCVDTRVAQELWHDRMTYAAAWVVEGAKQPDTVFSPQQLELMAEKPDYVLSVRKFLSAVVNGQWGSESAEARLREDFARCIAAANPHYSPAGFWLV